MSCLGLWDVISKKGIKHMATRRLNQDCLEKYFAKIRSAGGSCKNPTPIQFSRAFRKLFTMAYFKVSEGTNSVDELDSVLVSISDASVCFFYFKNDQYLKI